MASNTIILKGLFCRPFVSHTTGNPFLVFRQPGYISSQYIQYIYMVNRCIYATNYCIIQKWYISQYKWVYCLLRKPTRDIIVHFFLRKIFLFPQGQYIGTWINFNSATSRCISARLHCTSARTDCISARLNCISAKWHYFRKVCIISARLSI